MTEEEIKQRVIKIIADVLQDSIELGRLEKMSFIDAFDSISFVQMIIQLEEEFGIEIDGEYLLLDMLSNLEAVISMLQTLQNQKDAL